MHLAQLRIHTLSYSAPAHVFRAFARRSLAPTAAIDSRTLCSTIDSFSGETGYSKAWAISPFNRKSSSSFRAARNGGGMSGMNCSG